LEEKSSSELNLPTAPDCVKKQEFDMVNVQWFVSSFAIIILLAFCIMNYFLLEVCMQWIHCYMITKQAELLCYFLSFVVVNKGLISSKLITGKDWSYGSCPVQNI
jgi:uncharacterized membrane protein